MHIELDRLKTKFDSFMELRKVFNERFTTITEQVGELRGMIMDTNRNLETSEIKATKAIDLVTSVQPDKLMSEVQKGDGKIEALKANLESNEVMMKTLMDELKKVKSQVSLFKGVEQVIKLNTEVKNELMNVKKVEAVISRHADKIENIFVESQKMYHQFESFPDEINYLKNSFKNVTEGFDEMKVKYTTLSSKKEHENLVVKFDKFIKRVGNVMDTMQGKAEDIDDQFKKTKRKLDKEFNDRVYRADVMSNAFENLLKKNPLFIKELDLLKYMEEQSEKNAKEEKKEEAKPKGDSSAKKTGLLNSLVDKFKKKKEEKKV